MEKMIAVAQEHTKRKLRTVLIKEIYDAPTNDQAEKFIKQIPLETGRKQWYVSPLVTHAPSHTLALYT